VDFFRNFSPFSKKMSTALVVFGLAEQLSIGFVEGDIAEYAYVQVFAGGGITVRW
jgi:hypothetical protein